MNNGTKPCNKALCSGSFAQGKWTNQSSTQAASINAVDLKYWPRELDGSCSLTEYEWEPWWVVDLGQSETVVKIVITIDAQRLYRLDDTVIRVGDILTEPTSNNQCRDSITEKDIQSYRVNIECSPTPRGRYLSLQKENKYGVINICEIDVFVSALKCPFQEPYLAYSLPAATGIPVSWKNPTVVIKEKLGKISCSHTSGSVFPIGQTEVTCISQRTSTTYSNTCSFLVNVEVCKNTFHSKCYKIFSKKQTYLNSVETCRRAGYQLATVRSSEENAYIKGMMTKTLGNDSYAFLKRDLIFHEDIFKDKNNSTTFSNWSADERSDDYNMVGQQQCAVIEAESGKWTKDECKHQKTSVCETTLTNCQHSFNNGCYFVIQTKQGYERSKELCKNIGGEPVTIPNSTVNKYIKSLVKNEVFIGLTLLGPKATWEWNDGTKLTFTKWLKGYPKKNGKDRGCVVMKKSGRWKNVSCNQRSPAVCKTSLI
ncbi:uncharacterized protein [Antedon mediterranea]|uniref:uncharacterized protein n=1 Tax=Antedon mediterranea TaxID=105859 RepID=UPI003AF7B5FE